MKRNFLIFLALFLFVFGASSWCACPKETGGLVGANTVQKTLKSSRILAEEDEPYLVQAPVSSAENCFGINYAKIEYSTEAATPWVSVISPNGGEEWCVQSNHNITFSCLDVSNVRIEYTTNSGSTWMTIINSTPCSTGSYPWAIPNTPSSNCAVKICDAVYHYYCDNSNGFFSIITCSPGDVTGDGVVEMGDVVFLINYIFKGGSAPDPLANGDVNADCLVELADVVYLINYVYKNGDPPLIGCA